MQNAQPPQQQVAPAAQQASQPESLQARGSGTGYTMYRQNSGASTAQSGGNSYGQSVGAAVDSMRNMHVSNPHYAASNGGHLMQR